MPMLENSLLHRVRKWCAPLFGCVPQSIMDFSLANIRPVPGILEHRGSLEDLPLQRRRLHWLALRIMDLLEVYRALWSESKGATNERISQLLAQWVWVERFVQTRFNSDVSVVMYMRNICSPNEESRRGTPFSSEPLCRDIKSYIRVIRRRAGTDDRMTPEINEQNRASIRLWLTHVNDILAVFLRDITTKKA